MMFSLSTILVGGAAPLTVLVWAKMAAKKLFEYTRPAWALQPAGPPSWVSK